MKTVRPTTELPWKRRKTRRIKIGQVQVGGGAPIVVESMTKTDTADVRATARQIRSLERAGCELVRVAVPDMAAARNLGKIASRCTIPVMADIHFDHRLALVALEEGLPGVRLNPGNITNRKRVEEVVRSAEAKLACIRIGVNAGSVAPEVLARHGIRAVDKAMVESALSHIRILESLDFKRIVVSVKSSEVPSTVSAYRRLSKLVRYPLHVGITEAGTLLRGSVVSAAGVAILLSEGIGDAVRVSLAANPVREVEVAFRILGSMGLRDAGPAVICCPTCGRCEIDVVKIARQVEAGVRKVYAPLRIAVMGCGVNGPGEARHADVGIAGGKVQGLLFKGGRVIGKVKEKDLVRVLLDYVYALAAEAEEPKSRPHRTFGDSLLSRGQ